MPKNDNGMAKPPLIYLITDGEATDENFESKSSEIIRLFESAVSAHIPLIQIREKKLSAKLLFELAGRAAGITKGSGTKLLINGRSDVAYMSGADGVHLPSDSVPIKAIRESFGKEFTIGASVHSFAEARIAEAAGADFVTFGPVFNTPSKEKFGEPQGLGNLKEVTQNLSIPVIAIGGVDDANYESVMHNGAAGFAAIRFLQDGKNLADIVQRLK